MSRTAPAPSYRVFASCAPGLEPVLATEITTVGGTEAQELAGGVAFSASGPVLHRAHLELGVASHVRVRVATFRARAFGELVKRAGAVDWRSWIDPGQPLGFRATSRRSRLYHTKAIVERVRTAVTDALGATPPEGGDSDPTLVARFEHDECTLSLDTTGAPLHRRGYRLATAKAPLREDLARALVALSRWEAGGPLFDPFCGSGTIAIEAALVARRIAPGRGRSFALERTPLFDAATWDRVCAEAEARALASCPVPIVASDRDAGAVRAAGDNAERAGVRSDLRIERAALSDAPFTQGPLPEHGALLTNPPHGGRVGKAPRLGPLYQTLGRLLAERPASFRVALLVADRRLALRTGLPLETAALTDQGGHRVRILRA